MVTYLQVTTATPNQDEAVTLARSAVKLRLAAGVQVSGPVVSVFRHLGEFGEGQEWKVTFKTTGDRYPELESHLMSNHPWDNPEIVATEIVEAPKAYLEWLISATRPDEFNS